MSSTIFTWWWRTPKANLVAGMKWFLGPIPADSTGGINCLATLLAAPLQVTGFVDGSGNGLFVRTACDYVPSGILFGQAAARQDNPCVRIGEQLSVRIGSARQGGPAGCGWNRLLGEMGIPQGQQGRTAGILSGGWHNGLEQE